MAMSEATRPAIYGAIAGAVLTMVVGFSWGGWVTGSGAAKLVTAAGKAGTLQAQVLQCVELARLDPDRAGKIATITAASSYARRDAVMATGWAQLPGMTAPDRDLATACAIALMT